MADIYRCEKPIYMVVSVGPLVPPAVAAWIHSSVSLNCKQCGAQQPKLQIFLLGVGGETPELD